MTHSIFEKKFFEMFKYEIKMNDSYYIYFSFPQEYCACGRTRRAGTRRVAPAGAGPPSFAGRGLAAAWWAAYDLEVDKR